MKHDLTEPVAAAAKAHFDRIQSQRRDAGRLNDDGSPIQWEQLTPLDQHAFREFVAPLVSAAFDAAEPCVKQPQIGPWD
jgi:hypothetical protein